MMMKREQFSCTCTISVRKRSMSKIGKMTRPKKWFKTYMQLKPTTKDKGIIKLGFYIKTGTTRKLDTTNPFINRS